jgi:hypothetical protein
MVRSFGLTASQPHGSKSSDLRPLARLVPFLTRYRGHLILAVVALLVAAAATLSVPVAVRRVIDHAERLEKRVDQPGRSAIKRHRVDDLAGGPREREKRRL